MNIGIIGTGLIGGSVGMAFKTKGHRVYGWDISDENLDIAKRRFAIDEAPGFEAVCQQEFVFVAVPPSNVIASLESVFRHKLESTIVSDCTSIKSEIAAWATTERLKDFVPGHPMAGHEKSGPGFASGWMFRGAKWILTPTKFTSKEALASVTALIKGIDAIPVKISAESHDRHVGVLSHLPHVVAATLCEIGATLDNPQVSGGSWKDLTRVAGVDPNLWTQILMGNREEMVSILSEMESRLRRTRESLEAGDAAEIGAWLKEIVKIKETKK